MAAMSTDTAMCKLRERLPEKRRKDAILAVEYVMTASPEWWKAAASSHANAAHSQFQPKGINQLQHRAITRLSARG